jgi:hypothetical protein
MIEAALPPISRDRENRMNKVLDSILSGRIDVYMGLDYVDGKSPELYGLVATATIDLVDGTDRQLLIYAVYGYRKLEISQVIEVFDLIKKIAKAEGCNSIVGYTNVTRLIEYVKQMGWEANYTFVKADI